MTQNTALHQSLKVTCKRALLAMALLFFIFLSPSSGFSTESVPLTIIHSGNVNGHLFPCPT